MQIHVLLFGVLRDIVGRPDEMVDLPAGARVELVLNRYGKQFPRFAAMQGVLAVSVNREFARADRLLAAGDEVGLLPPVSGGGPEPLCGPGEVRIVRAAIEMEAVLSPLKRAADGAAVVFEGIVRDNSRGRRTLYLDYEAYEAMALRQMQMLAEEGRRRFSVDGVSIIHRVGRIEIGETSVLIVVSSAHRAAAFDACRWIIDTLKKTVPIWKKEYFEDGAVWADGEPFPGELSAAQGTVGEEPASK
jgi:molybdopterin synthase catalytic subunit/molybdopterin converting factor small subunit